MSNYSTLKQHSEERARLVQDATATAVTVVVGRRRALTGIRWRADLIVTAAEAIGGAERVGVRLDGVELDGEVIATDLGTDIAVLRMTAGGTVPDAQDASAGPGAGSVPVAPSRPALRAGVALRAGETIALIGRTLRGPAALWGSVQLAGPAWSSRRGGKIDQLLELDVGFVPAFEGAAVIDMDGALAAMAVPGPCQRVLGIPAETIESVVTKVEKFGHLPKPYIGIRLQALRLDDDARNRLGRKSRGIAAVGAVDAGSPAAEAQIQLGDLLLSVDGETAEGVNELARRVAGSSPGQTVVLEVLRGGKPLTITVRVGERPRR